MLYRSVRVRVPEKARLTELRSRGEPIVYVAWHDRFLLPLLHHRDEGVVAMASRSKDGELAARLASSLGYAVVRGSTGKGGQEALAELAEAMRAGKSVAITVDGPRGPRHVVKTGAMTLARETGAWILPISCHANRAWTFEKSWDRFYLPKPFSIVTITYGTAAKVRVEDDLAAAKERLKLDLDAISTAPGAAGSP